MTWFHALQLALAAVAFAVAMRRVRASRRAPGDVEGLARDVYSLRGLGRMALPLAFVGVIVDLGRGLEASAGQVGTAGAGELALTRALTGLAIGGVSAVACLGIAASWRRKVVDHVDAGGRRGARARTLDRAEGGV